MLVLVGSNPFLRKKFVYQQTSDCTVVKTVYKYSGLKGRRNQKKAEGKSDWRMRESACSSGRVSLLCTLMFWTEGEAESEKSWRKKWLPNARKDCFSACSSGRVSLLYTLMFWNGLANSKYQQQRCGLFWGGYAATQNPVYCMPTWYSVLCVSLSKYKHKVIINNIKPIYPFVINLNAHRIQ